MAFFRQNIFFYCMIGTLCNFNLLSNVRERPELDKILNLVNDAKGGDRYNTVLHPAGYHTLYFEGVTVPGLRDPIKRLSQIPYDFSGKTILDIGTNQGGMLFALADKIEHGIGIDFNRKLINVANKVKSLKKIHNIDFFTFDLDNDNLERIRDLVPSVKVDICFFLAMCAWVKNWRKVIELTASLAPALLFESNGKGQDQQVRYLSKYYKNVVFIEKQGHRRVYLCHNPS